MTESRRNDILRATVTAIADRGLCETRIADVADIVGVSPALVLYYFPTKAALLSEALVYLDRLFYEGVSNKLDTATSAEIMSLFQQLNREEGITVVVVTHEADIAAYARRHVAFRDGLIVQDALQATAA